MDGHALFHQHHPALGDSSSKRTLTALLVTICARSERRQLGFTGSSKDIPVPTPTNVRFRGPSELVPRIDRSVAAVGAPAPLLACASLLQFVSFQPPRTKLLFCRFRFRGGSGGLQNEFVVFGGCLYFLRKLKGTARRLDLKRVVILQSRTGYIVIGFGNHAVGSWDSGCRCGFSCCL